MNNRELQIFTEKLVDRMGKTIDEKINIEIKKNNKKIFDVFMIFVQLLILSVLIYLELNK